MTKSGSQNSKVGSQQKGEGDVLFKLAALTKPRGAEIVETIDEAYPSGVNQSRIYQILQSLERNGLADSRDVDGRSKVYWVTDEGREAVREYYEWMAVRFPKSGIKKMQAGCDPI